MLQRALLLLLAAVALTGCSHRAPRLYGVEVVEAHYPIAGEWPSQIVVAAGVENDGSRIKLLSGRVRLSYDDRRVVVLTLEQKVVLPPRSGSRVVLPLRVSVARSTQSLALREALRTGATDRISVDWQLAVRRGVAYAEIETESQPLDNVLGAEQREMLLEILNEINEE